LCRPYSFVLFLVALGAFSATANSQIQPPKPAQSPAPASAVRGVLITVVDENGVVVALAKVTLQNNASHNVFTGQTDFAGRLTIRALPADAYHVHIEKAGFYALDDPAVTLG